jgi:uncharacterized protein YdeI (YjbR/CyaY-like superfamily)
MFLKALKDSLILNNRKTPYYLVKLNRVRNMSTQFPFTDLPVRSFSTAADFESFLEREHEREPGFYLKLAKKSSGLTSVTSAEALEVALCFGWINGRGNAFDDNWYTARYTPRRPASLWSQKNVEAVEQLMKEGRMRPAGIAAIDAAKADGRWQRAYATPTNMQVPDDFQIALDAEETAKAFFEGLNKGGRYQVLLRIETSTPANRASKIQATVQMLAAGKVPGQITKSTSKVKTKPATSKVKKPASASSKSEKHTVSSMSKREGLRPRTLD